MGMVDAYATQVEIFIGPFGSGKTEVVLNRALHLAARGAHVSVIDVDVVDPFFRARQARACLAAGGVTLVAPSVVTVGSVAAALTEHFPTKPELVEVNVAALARGAAIAHRPLTLAQTR